MEDTAGRVESERVGVGKRNGYLRKTQAMADNVSYTTLIMPMGEMCFSGHVLRMVS